MNVVSHRRKVVIAGLTLAAMMLSAAYVWYHRSFSCNPWKLRYEIGGAILDIDFNYIRWCRVPLGTPEPDVIREFPLPVLRADSGDQQFRRYVHAMSDGAGFTRPPDRPGRSVLVYEAGSNNDMIIVYYYFKKGRLEETFISEY